MKKTNYTVCWQDGREPGTAGVSVKRYNHLENN